MDTFEFWMRPKISGTTSLQVSVLPWKFNPIQDGGEWAKRPPYQSFQTLSTRPHLQYDLSYVIKFGWWCHRQKIWRHNLFSKYLYFKNAQSSHFSRHHQSLQPYLLKKSLKTQNKLKELEIMYQYAIYTGISWYSKICRFPVKKKLISGELKWCVTWFIYFLDLL